MNQRRSPRVALISFTFILLIALIGSLSLDTQAAAKKGRGRAAGKSSGRSRGAAKRGGRGSRRESARARRGGGRKMSKRELRAANARIAKERSAYMAKLQRRGKMSKRELAAEMRRFDSTHRRALAEARRRAEAARAAAIARQRAIDEGMRNEAADDIAKDSTVGEDLEVRRAAVNALGHHAGTVVVMDPKSGRVYTVVNQEWALRRGFKPCSTIKLVTGVAGISEKIIQPTEEVNYGNYSLNLTEALAHSNNTYFQRVGGEVGFDKMVSYAREMGLGERTGINYANESAGKVPLFKSGYAVNHMSSHGDDFEVTAIQLASLVSAMSNGGKLLTPHVPRTVEENDKFKSETRRRINISRETLDRMLPGMIGAVNYGSGRKAYRPEQTVAGKTGTCIGQGAWLGLFTSYAPVADPKLAVVVITRGTDAHNHLPAAVAGDIYRALSPRFGTQINFQVAQTADDEETSTKDKKSAALDEEAQETKAATQAEEKAIEEKAEKEAADATEKSLEATDANANTKAPPAVNSKVRPTVMPVDNKPKTQKATTPAKPAATQPADGRPRKINEP
jgi:penicillin-binding protein 2